MTTPEPKKLTSIRISNAGLAAIDAIATERDWPRSQAIRYLMTLGLEAWKRGERLNRPSR